MSEETVLLNLERTQYKVPVESGCSVCIECGKKIAHLLNLKFDLLAHGGIREQ